MTTFRFEAVKLNLFERCLKFSFVRPDKNVQYLSPHLCLFLLEPFLLMTNDGSWSADPEPGDRLHGGPSPVLHDVAANQRSRPAQASLAVH